MKHGPIRIVIAGGGTGGHLYPGIALAEALQEKWQAEILFIGTAHGIENGVLRDYPFQLKRIWMRGLLRKASPTNLLFPLRLLDSIVQCCGYFMVFRPKAIIGTGGYVSGPALLAGLVMGKTTIIQEQNSYPGLVNRWLGKYVDQVHLTYEDSRNYFGKQTNVFVSGNPVRVEEKQVTREDARAAFGLAPAHTTLLAFGGSQGAHNLNLRLLDSLEKLLDKPDLQILWATGKMDYAHIQARTERWRNRVSVYSFITDMMLAYRAADVALCRSGASTLSELAVAGVPAILVPFPYATAQHQEANARSVVKADAALMLLEQDLTADSLTTAILDLVSDADRLQAMSEAARRLAKPAAAAAIVGQMSPLLNSD
jgi:UDP-N-acetylglucosamine--N-acetylmuramyl-(pentapeptide) pyrophosphoryl-undecaprenol N-acetylglucosamine transferase